MRIECSLEEELKRKTEMYEKKTLKYEKMIKLLFYGMQYEWVKEMIEQSDLITIKRLHCCKSEIEELISYIKEGS